MSLADLQQVVPEEWLTMKFEWLRQPRFHPCQCGYFRTGFLREVMQWHCHAEGLRTSLQRQTILIACFRQNDVQKSVFLQE